MTKHTCPTCGQPITAERLLPLIRTIDLIGPITLTQRWHAWREHRRMIRRYRRAVELDGHRSIHLLPTVQHQPELPPCGAVHEHSPKCGPPYGP